MPGRAAFDYAVVRVVPRPERGERLNAGVILFAPTLAYLGCGFGLDDARLLVLDHCADAAAIRRHLDGLAAVCAGDREAGPVARLPQRERFHWLVSPRSTVIQISAVHSGICGADRSDAEQALARLFAVMVAKVGQPDPHRADHPRPRR